jgi:hypothetical protein
MFGQDWVTLAVAAVVGVLSVGRMSRLVVEDDWPPTAWFRNRWVDWFNTSAWSGLVLCVFCVSPYIAAAVLAWAVLSDLHWSWWAFNGWLAASYLAAIVVARDLPADSRE